MFLKENTFACTYSIHLIFIHMTRFFGQTLANVQKVKDNFYETPRYTLVSRSRNSSVFIFD